MRTKFGNYDQVLLERDIEKIDIECLISDLTIYTETMRKVIAAINMTLDAVCDHTAGLPDEEIHSHYTDLLKQGDVILYGRVTYQLMEFWRQFLDQPSEEASMNEFAEAIDSIQKIVFSNTLREIDWSTTAISERGLEEEVLALKQLPGKPIFVGSRSLIIQLLQLNLVDELQLCIYPMVEGKGLSLFEGIEQRMIFKLVDTKTFESGAVILYYQIKNE